jgi:uncharacterized protein (DUF1778 family)
MPEARQTRTIRWSEAEIAIITKAAADKGANFSEFVREAALRLAKARREGK